MSATYQDVYKRSLDDPHSFWAEIADDLHWDKKWDTVLDESNPPFYQWFVGGQLNVCYNALDYHVEHGRADQLALVYDSPVTDSSHNYTYLELRDEVAKFAGVLASQGINKGDRVVIYMPMVPEAAIAMLACARLGAIHSVVFGGFAANELAVRIEDAEPKLIVSASCGIEPTRIVSYKPLLDEAIELSSAKPDTCIILQRPQKIATMINGRDLDWVELMAAAAPADCVSVASTDPLYVLYTSGTTGIPKGVVRDTGGHAVALKWSMTNIYGVEAGDVYWAGSDVGWVVGHSYIVYAPLLKGCTTIMYEGKPIGTPDAGAYWRVIEEHGINVFFTAPTAIRAIRREDLNGDFIRQYDISKLRALFLAGERCDPDTLVWAQEQLNIPVIDHWWQTETGWPVGANCMGLGLQPIKPGSCTTAVPGYDVQILDDNGNQANVGNSGSVVIKLPLPPGCLMTLWNNDERFKRSYLANFPGYYQTADAGFKDDDGYIYIMSRTDDVIQVAGHRISNGAIEEVVASHPDIAECAVIGIPHDIKGEVPMGLVVLNKGVVTDPDTIIADLIQMVRDKVGPVASFKNVVIVKRLPKTRSGKTLRRTLKEIASGVEYKIPATIDDATILPEVTLTLTEAGFPN